MDTPQVFDWVTARGACSLEQMFRKLMEVAEADAKAASALPGRRSHDIVEFERLSMRKFQVGRQWERGGAIEGEAILFEMMDAKVSVKAVSAQKILFTATPSMDHEGRCRFVVDGNPLELWQVTRMALEGLLFD